MSKRFFTFLLISMLTLVSACNEEIDKPSVLLIVLDAVRADHLSCYGYERNTSPTLDSLARAGILYSQCQAQSPWTLPSCGSIVSGLSVKSHGVVSRERDTYRIDTSTPTLGTVLSAEGFKTAGVVNNPLLSHAIGFADGMEYYSYYPEGDGRAEETVDESLAWLDDNGDSPFFLMIHIMDPHAPYSPPPPFDTEYSEVGLAGASSWILDENDHTIVLNPEDKNQLIDMYDGEIRWTDMQLGRLFAGIREMNLADSLLIIVVADHGDEFLEHGGVDHGHTLFQELLHVPLIIAGTGLESGIVINDPVGQFDIFPTVLDYLDINLAFSIDGISLLSDSVDNRVLPSSGLRSGSLTSVLHNSSKIIGDMESQEYMKFNLSNDPAEMTPLQADSMDVHYLELYWTTPPMYTPPLVGDQAEVQNSLQDLGYIR